MKEQIKEMLEMAEIVRQADMSNNVTGHNTDYKQFSDEAITQYGCGRLNGVSMLYNAGFRKQREGKNISKMHPVDEFICSECGAIFRDVPLVVIDEENEDELYYEFEFKFCPRCGAKVKGDEGK